MSKEQVICKAPKKNNSFAVLGVVMGLVGIVALVVLWLNRKIFINKYRSCRERSEEHTSELQSRETISYAVFCLKKKT